MTAFKYLGVAVIVVTVLVLILGSYFAAKNCGEFGDL